MESSRNTNNSNSTGGAGLSGPTSAQSDSNNNNNKHPQQQAVYEGNIDSMPPRISSGASVSSAKKTSKTRKVLNVARRPLRAVGRVVGSAKKNRSRNNYGTIEFGEDDMTDVRDETLVEDDGDLDESEDQVANRPPRQERRNSFMERVNSSLRGGIGVGGRDVGDVERLFATRFGDEDEQRDWVVFTMERYLRILALAMLAYELGVYHSEWRHHVRKALEYVTVAWVTCCVLWIMSSTSSTRDRISQRRRRNRRASASISAAPTQLATISSAATSSIEQEPKLNYENKEGAFVTTRSADDAESNKMEEEVQTYQVPVKGLGNEPCVSTTQLSGDLDSVGGVETVESKDAARLSTDVGMPHESLNPLYVMETLTGERVVPNATKPYHLSTEWFEGEMVALIRTPDCDDPEAPKGNSENDLVVNYMKDKQRRFEFQYQIKLKKVPDGQKIYFAAELDEPVKLGIVQRAFVGAAMAFMKSTNNSFHFSMAGSKEDPDGRWEKPHMSFPVEMSMDRLVVTKPGETPPKLGNVIDEDPESVKARKKGALIDWNLEDTYTLALWTAYVDFLDWRVINLPGIRPFELSKVIGQQPILLTLYLIPLDRAAEKHYRRDITSVVEMELSNTDVVPLAQYARKWVNANMALKRTVSDDSNNVDEDDEDDDEDDDDDLDDDDIDEDDDDDEMLNNSSKKGKKKKRTRDGSLADYAEYDAADAATAAELGEGMYLRSGDKVVLKESGPDGDDSAPCFLTNGAGFVVLQEGAASSIVIQKARRRASTSTARSELIRSGDSVSIKLLTKGRSGETETRYLSIHRGWWLKWVNTPPTKNGFFTIYTHESEFSDHGQHELRSSETQSSYLTFGGSFWLRHRRWSQYSVGVSAEGSATYGGRILGLYLPGSNTNPNEMNDNSDDEELPQTEGGDKGKRTWMKPLQLRAYEKSQINASPSLPITKVGSSEEQPLEDLPSSDQPKLVFSNEDSQLDVPAWVEMMNRTERIRQLTYVVRVVPKSNDAPSEASPVAEQALSKAFARLRTGRDLAEIMRVGLSWRDSSSSSKRRGSKPEALTPLSAPQTPVKSSSQGEEQAEVYATPTKGPVSPVAAASPMDGSFEMNADGESDSGPESDDEEDLEELLMSSVGDLTASKKSTKRRIVGSTIGAIGKVAKAGAKVGAKAGTGVAKAGIAVTKAGVGTGKKVVVTSANAGKKVVVTSAKTGVKIGKGTVSVGVSAGKKIGKGTVSVGAKVGKKVIGGSSSKNPPAKEPKYLKGNVSTNAGASKWRKERDLHVAVNKTVQAIGPDHLYFLAGELSAPEQSYRTVSNVLARMSSVPTSSPFSKRFNDILSNQITESSEQDAWFLNGGAMQVGVVPEKTEALRGSLVADCLVARCLWESHWREEWCGVYQTCIEFYAPLTQKPCLELSFIDIQSVRTLDQDLRSPLPGFPVLVIETAWLCHYVAFANEDSRENIRDQIQKSLPKSKSGDDSLTQTSERELWKARFWQGFQSSVESDSAVGRGKWAVVPTGKKTTNRTILNSRRMVFDLDPTFLKEAGGPGKFVEDLLSTSLSFSLSSLERDPEGLVKFLDSTSYLRLISLLDFERSSVGAFCLVVNLYHCLLQHSLLLAVNGPLHRRTVNRFMRSTCYEVGGDVFSLAEIQSCIIRGNMSRPVSPKPPYVEASRKSSAYRFYALQYTDPRINFVLNTGDIACPQDVPVLRPDRLDEQLNIAAITFLDKQLQVDSIRRVVLLPKVCEVYKNDFENEASGCLHYCSRYLEASTVSALKKLLREETSALTMKYQASADQYHTKLVLREEEEGEEDEEDGVELEFEEEVDEVPPTSGHTATSNQSKV